jgi:hypothetical protein
MGPEVGLVQQANIDPVLPEEVIQFLLSAANSVGIPAGQPQGFAPRYSFRPCCHIQLRKLLQS